MLKETIIDKFTKMLGDYIATHANMNILTQKCDKLTEMENIVTNIDNTISSIKDDPVLVTKLTEYKIKKQEEMQRVLNAAMYDILPKPTILNADDYKKVSGSCGSPDTLVLKDKDDPMSTLNDILNDLHSEPEQKKKITRKRDTSYTPSYSSGGCGCSSYKSGGC